MDPVEIKSAVLKTRSSDIYEALIMENDEIIICDIYHEEVERFNSKEEAEEKYLMF